MAEYCIDCNKLNIRDKYDRRVRCTYKCEYITPKTSNDYNCYGYCYDYSRSSSDKNEVKNYIEYYNNGCYITTIICNILGMNNTNYYLETLRNFRNNYMQTNINYLPLLAEYDIIGPIISNKIINSKNNQQIAYTIFNKYITKCVNLIERKKYKEVITIYTIMTLELKKLFKLNKYHITDKVINSLSISKSGHGKIKTK